MSNHYRRRVAALAVPPPEPTWLNTVSVSTLAELQDEIDSAGTIPTQIQVTSSFETEGTPIIVPSNATIKLTSVGGPFTIDAESSERLVENSGTLYVSELILANGYIGDYGGGVYNEGTLVLQDGGRITGSSVANGYSGAGVYNTEGATLIMTGGEIDSNFPADTNIFGAGVANHGMVQMYSGSIHDNMTGATPIAGNGGDGGGIYNEGIIEMYGGDIYQNAAHSGGGVYGGIFTLYAGNINNNTATSDSAGGAEGGGGVAAGDFAMLGGAIFENSALGFSNGGGVYVLDEGVVNIESGLISGNISQNNGGGVFVLCDDLESLFVGEEAIFTGNSAAFMYNRRQQDNAVYYSHIVGTNWTSPFTQGYNGFDIAYPCGDPFAAPTDVFLTGQKSAVGASLPAGFFQFGVYDEFDRLLATATNDAAGNIVFPSILLNQIATNEFIIRENTPSGNGWIVDDSEFPVMVDVIDNGADQLVATVSYPEGEPSFINTFASAPGGTARIMGSKSTVGGPLLAGKFEFGLFNESGARVLTTMNNGQGIFTFELEFTSPGLYSYTVKETTRPRCGWSTDTRIYPVTVEVTENTDGQLFTTVTYPEGAPTFVNTFLGCGESCDRPPMPHFRPPSCFKMPGQKPCPNPPRRPCR